MKQYDATSLPNPQIKHAKNVEFPLNDKDSYFNLKILRQKEIFIACLYIFSFFCNYVSLFWKYAQIWRIIRESANTRLTKMFEAIFRSLKVSTSFDTLLWPLSWQGQLKKNHPALQLLLHIVFWMLALQFRTVSLDHFYYCVQSSHPLLWWRRRRRLFMGDNIAHISHNRWWCTFFELVYFVP